MKVKKVRIGIKSVKEALNDFVRAGEAVGRGEKVKSEKGVYFESLAGFRKALTPKRLELLHLIREKHPESLRKLSRLSGRNMKNVVTDVSLLESLGLIEMHRAKKGRREATPQVSYARISLEIAV
jgi:predicted transcriptional regulator